MELFLLIVVVPLVISVLLVKYVPQKIRIIIYYIFSAIIVLTIIANEVFDTWVESDLNFAIILVCSLLLLIIAIVELIFHFFKWKKA